MLLHCGGWIEAVKQQLKGSITGAASSIWQSS
jgi:hypothetical protein